MMNFAQWLLKRAIRKMFGDWQWVYEYRKMIRDLWPLAFILTTLAGALFFIGVNLFVMFAFDVHLTRDGLYAVAAVPYLFFVYNWLAGLYEIYDTERMATWDAVKRPYND